MSGQLALYGRVLRRLYPNHRPARPRWFWTAGPTLMELPEMVLDAALSRLIAANDTSA